ncbi:MAG: methyltransferase domain-containing protein [Candidatus Omnitrophota bacterium]
METKDKIWKREDLSKRYLEGVRGAIPLADYQLKIILMMVEKARPRPGNVLDLGCGDGILGLAVMSRYPRAKGVFLDVSDTMIAAAKKKAGKLGRRCVFITEDYGKPSWAGRVKKFGRFDVIVSGLSIHHQPDRRKKQIYREIFGLLEPGGLFLNLEHVSSPTPWLEKVFNEMFIDCIYRYHCAAGSKKTRAEIARTHYNNPLKDANILSPAEKQCSWLRKIGFKEVDCYLKVFELAIFGGIKPED